MKSKFLLVFSAIILSAVISVFLLSTKGDLELFRKKSQQVRRKRFSLPKNSIVYVKQPHTGDINFDKSKGQALYIRNGGTPGDDGLNRELIYQNVLSTRTLRLTEEETVLTDPVYPNERMVKIRVDMDDTFKGRTITGYLAANSAGSVVQYPEEQLGKRTELKMQYYWRIEEYLDGFALVNRWQTVNRYVGLSQRVESHPARSVKLPTGQTIRVPASTVKTFRPDWWNDSVSTQLLPLYIKK